MSEQSEQSEQSEPGERSEAGEPGDEAKAAHPPGLAMLTKRRIEAEILGHVYAVLKARDGAASAQQVIGDAVRRSSIEQAKAFADEQGGKTSLDSFIAISVHWEKGDALKLRVNKQTPTEYAFDVVRCQYAEMYKAMGLHEIGHLLSCQRDATFCEGYNPDLHFSRSQTIMQGASHCDFHYTYTPPADPG